MKRKAESQSNGHNGKSALKKRAKTVLSEDQVKESFRTGLFAPDVLKKYTNEYAASEPYKHSVISPLIDDALLRSVRNEIRENVHFTPKETDIYKIHQSGDLANLDGLEDSALEKLPSLLKLRDALYSEPFRKYVAGITGSGELSGRKTDMAINVYTPGCHLLCHDDVIGSRRVSYILYLVDPDIPWKAEWGGALRLYPTKTHEDDGEKTKTPSPDFTKVIPPAWNQLSFFAVQPGESFHDVEEVYHAETKEQLEKEGGRVRMAISGWFHIPQIGEEGYIEGAEEKWGANSSLKQLEGNPDRYDFPRFQSVSVEVPEDASQEKAFDEAELDFLLKYMSPTYLTPDTLEQVSDRFLDLSSVTLDGLLSPKFSDKIRSYVESQEASPLPINDSTSIESSTSWKVAKPPHKHRFLYQQPSSSPSKPEDMTPIEELLNTFLPSPQFRKWLSIATECEIENYDIIARRFRKGTDYSLATSHEGQPRLEISLGLTPTPGWGADEDEEEAISEPEEEDAAAALNGEEKGKEKTQTNGKAKTKSKALVDEEKEDPETVEEPEDDVGGHEVYMASSDDASDAAIYKAANDGDEDDNVLFSQPASWNKLSIVLRDSGVLKFVKYVSMNAKGDRWDIGGSFGVKELDEVDEEEEVDTSQETSQENQISLEDSEEEAGVWNGFASEGDSESD